MIKLPSDWYSTVQRLFNPQKPTTKENEFIPRAKNIVCVEKTVFPDGKPRFSPNGTGEFYGLIEEKK